MENYENEELRQESEHTQPQPEEAPQQPQHTAPQQNQPYSGTGVGRKESPFADSPYVMNHGTQNSYQNPYQYQSGYVPPVEEPPVKKPKAKKKRNGKVGKTILAAVLALAVLAGGCGITALLVNNRWESQMQLMQDDYNTRLDEMQAKIDAAAGEIQSYPQYITVDGSSILAPGVVYANNVKSVVLINSTVTSSYYGQTATGISAGSGFILSEDGYVITNHHVIEGATSITVTMHDGTEYPAELVGSDSTNDVAVLKVEATDLPAVTLGSSDALAVGDQVVAIGNPLGELTSTLTVGYVSAKDRDVTTDGTVINMIQTDAAINSGNSGGPLFNMNGEVVGITTAKYSGESSSGATIEGIGFAIPIDDVSGIISDLIDYGYVTGAYLGVMVSDMDASTASYYGLPVGVYIQEVTAGYCAEEAGLQAKDIIVALGEYEVESLTDLTRALRQFKAGDTTTITVYRSGQELTLPITLDEKPQTTEEEIQVPSDSEMPDEGSFEDWYNYFAPFFGKGNG